MLCNDEITFSQGRTELALMIRSASGNRITIKKGDRLGTVDLITSLPALKSHFRDKLGSGLFRNKPLLISR